MNKIHPYKYIRFAVDSPWYREDYEVLPARIKTHVQDSRPNVVRNGINIPGLFAYIGYACIRHEDYIDDFLGYINKKLPFPPFNSSGWVGTHLSWFKDNDNPFVYRCFNILDRIKDATPVILKSDNPGKIVYEDAYQVVVKIDNRRRNIEVFRRDKPALNP